MKIKTNYLYIQKRKRGKDNMELLKEYAKKYGLKKVINEMGETRTTNENSIVFPNGFVASIYGRCLNES